MFLKKPPIPIQRKRFPFLLLVTTLFCVWLLWKSLYPTLPAIGEPPRLYSSQAQQDLRHTIFTAIQRANRSIYLVMFGLSDPSLLTALSQKIARHVPTTVYYDPLGSPNLRQILSGGSIHPIKGSGLMHQKFLILDEETVFIGSANFTSASLKMHDNLVVGLTSRKVARFIQQHAPLSPANLRTMVGGQEIELRLLPDPRGHTLTEIRKKLRAATRSIHCALFTFTHTGLANELIRAHKRGVQVTVIIDLYSGIGASAAVIEQLKQAGVHVLTSQGTQLLHHKFALIDDQTLLMGSANWTKAAFTKNNDCILFLYNLTAEQKRFMAKLWQRLETGGKVY